MSGRTDKQVAHQGGSAPTFMQARGRQAAARKAWNTSKVPFTPADFSRYTAGAVIYTEKTNPEFGVPELTASTYGYPGMSMDGVVVLGVSPSTGGLAAHMGQTMAVGGIVPLAVTSGGCRPGDLMKADVPVAPGRGGANAKHVRPYMAVRKVKDYESLDPSALMRRLGVRYFENPAVVSKEAEFVAFRETIATLGMLFGANTGGLDEKTKNERTAKFLRGLPGDAPAGDAGKRIMLARTNLAAFIWKAFEHNRDTIIGTVYGSLPDAPSYAPDTNVVPASFAK